MTNSEAIREFAESKFDHLINEAIKKLAEKYLPIKGYEFAIDKYALLKVKEHDDFLSDLTALISEHYVAKEKYDKLLQQRDELKEALKWVKESITRWCFLGKADAMLKIEAAIKNTDTK